MEDSCICPPYLVDLGTQLSLSAPFSHLCGFNRKTLGGTVPALCQDRLRPAVVTHLEVTVPLLLASQQCIQHGPHSLFLVLVLATDDIAECSHPPEELLIHQADAAPAGQVGQVKVDRGAR